MIALPRWLRVAALPVALAAAVTGAAPSVIHIRVAPGDTLTAIAARMHTTVAALVALNHLPGNGNLIYAGQELAVPCGTATVAHRVVPGDTVDGLAAHYGVSPASVESANHLAADGLIRLGSTLAIPVSGCASAAPPAGGSGPVTLLAVPVPSRDQMRVIIANTARRLGVDPALALAISWQEAGFNQAMVSSAGAVGAMQVVPASARFVSRYLVGRPLNMANGYDNALAGVALLKQLLAEVPVPAAIAGYYQGLASVRAHGEYPSTRRYVADVLALRQRFGG